MLQRPWRGLGLSRSRHHIGLRPIFPEQSDFRVLPSWLQAGLTTPIYNPRVAPACTLLERSDLSASIAA